GQEVDGVVPLAVEGLVAGDARQPERRQLRGPDGDARQLERAGAEEGDDLRAGRRPEQLGRPGEAGPGEGRRGQEGERRSQRHLLAILLDQVVVGARNPVGDRHRCLRRPPASRSEGGRKPVKPRERRKKKGRAWAGPPPGKGGGTTHYWGA